MLQKSDFHGFTTESVIASATQNGNHKRIVATTNYYDGTISYFIINSPKYGINGGNFTAPNLAAAIQIYNSIEV